MDFELIKDFSDSVTLEIADKNESIIKIKYHTLNGNNPNANNNYIGLWNYSEGSSIKGKAVWSQKISKQTTDGTFSVDLPITSSAYILGYSQAGDPKVNEDTAKNLSACAVISAVGEQGKITLNTSMDVSGDSGEIILKYTLLNGTHNSDNWFGIWHDNDEIGVDAPFYSDKIDTRNDKVILDDIGFKRGGVYQLALFANNYDKLKAKDYDNSVKNMVSIIEFSFKGEGV